MPSPPVATMEGIMTLAAEWCTTNEVVMLRCVSASLFVVVNEWQYKDIVDEKDKLTWRKCPRIGTPTCRNGAPARLLRRHDTFSNFGGWCNAASPSFRQQSVVLWVAIVRGLKKTNQVLLYK